MKQLNIRRFVTIVPVSILMLVIAFTFGINSANAHAEYECGTYSAGTYNEGNSGTGESCPTDGGTPANPTTPPTSQPSGAGSTGTSSSNGSTNTTPPLTQNPVEGSQSITLNEYAAYLNGSGQEVSMKVGDKVYFTVGSEGHSVTLKEITADYIIVTVASTPVDVTIPVGKSVNYDVDKDGADDIKMSYDSFAADGLSSLVVFGALVTPDTATPVAAEVDPVKAEQNYTWIVIVGAVLFVIIAGVVIRKIVASKTPAA